SFRRIAGFSLFWSFHVADITDNAAALIDAPKAAAFDRHHLYEDAMAMLIGTSFIALGITLYSQAMLMT
ncbi:hypothetical protein C3731_21645, partial [Brucella oryzae]